MFRRRDHESFIGGYDPEREMPDPDREYRDRYQSDAYRHNAADSRWPYRWNPDRFEDRFGPRRGDEWGRNAAWDRDARDRDRGYDYDRGMEWDRMRYGYPRGPEPGGYRERDRDFSGPRDYGYRGYDRGFDRGDYRDVDRDRGFDRDRDRWEYDRWEYGDRDRDSGWRGRGGRY